MSTNLRNNIDCTVENKWTTKMVESYFEEVISTLKKLPPVHQRGYFSIWPEIIYSPNELIIQEKMPIRLRATPEAISRLEQTFELMRWVTVEERKLIWKRAVKAGWKVICWELGCNKSTAWRKWNIALEKIAKKLNQKI